MEAVVRIVGRAVRGTGSTVFTLVGALILGFGVPAGWLWIASQLSGKVGAVDSPVIAFIATGIIVTYWGVLVAAAWVRARLLARETADGHRHQPSAWNRSMRDSPAGDRAIDPIERLFIATVLIAGIAFLVWFALFASGDGPAVY